MADAASISAHPPCPKGAGPTPLRNPQKTQTAKRQGRKPTPIVEFPVAIEDHWDETRCFRDALDLHMRRHGDTGWRLHAAIVRPGETFNISTLASWRRGVRAPQDALSFEVLARIERRYRLSEGYFKSKLGNAPRATRGAAVLGLSEAEMRRLAWHLPDDFRRRPINEQHEIVDWVRRVIVSGSTDYRRFQAAALKQRYGLKLGSSAGDVEPAATTRAPQGAISGITGPCVLVREMAELVAFKSATLSTFGYERSGVWGTAFGHLQEMGVATESKLEAWSGYLWPDHKIDDEPELWLHRAVRLTWEQADILLWNQIAHEIGVMPQAPVMSKLIDLERGVSVNAYDDRGLDITSIAKESISGLYKRFDTWLLDHDRPRMAKALEG
ncbi:DUF3885 domain-containing protein [Phenylobacterium sp.]|uniref:DUF3885 domain-containing protein n=1 Tax=Phenylobacterium sp. TaxID=1871053 RepID=UPI002FC67975